MKEKFLLILTDDEIIFYKGSRKKIYSYTEERERIQGEIKNFLSLTPKTPLSLLIDRNHQDIREEELPPLWLWDRLRLLSHKRDAWRSQGGFYGYQFFKQNSKIYLQWVTIPQNDPLTSWISWLKSLSNPLLGVYFVSLEAGHFLKKHFAASPDYSLLIYKFSSHKIRYVIFKGKQLLLFRPLSGEEDLRTSLHFLSRNYPDIHEKLQFLSLINEIPLTFPNVKRISDPDLFLRFLTLQKKTTLSLNIHPLKSYLWLRRGKVILCIIALFLIGLNAYQGLEHQSKNDSLLSKIKALGRQIHDLKASLRHKDSIPLRTALEHYTHLKSQNRDPFRILEKLSILLGRHHLQLTNLVWRDELTEEIEISFVMQNYKGVSLANQFNTFLSSLSKAFPNSLLQILEGPFNSASHETYIYPSNSSLPRVHIRIVQP